MFKPKNHASQEKLLSAEMLAEGKELKRLAPTFGRTATEDFYKRAKVYNDYCKKVGATTMMVATSD